jgi:hypothetical protein
MTQTEAIVLGLCALLVLLPPRWDPAIRLKEWQIRKGIHPESKDAR